MRWRRCPWTRIWSSISWDGFLIFIRGSGGCDTCCNRWHLTFRISLGKRPRGLKHAEPVKQSKESKYVKIGSLPHVVWPLSFAIICPGGHSRLGRKAAHNESLKVATPQWQNLPRKRKRVGVQIGHSRLHIWTLLLIIWYSESLPTEGINLEGAFSETNKLSPDGICKRL